jgi:sterol desaturase/sphingolipid hydroxylase (fatty acid hydroxylase superfamily)
VVGKGEKGLADDNYFHYLHHRYFTVNYGSDALPLGEWFGSRHDGSPEAQARMLASRKAGQE